MKRSLQRLVRQRAQSQCEYCWLPQSYHPLPFHVDHIIAQQHHGSTISANLALACYDCNQYKGPNIASIDPDTADLTPLFHPRRDRWHEHFQWDGPALIGKTPIGRATVQLLRINEPIRVAHRRMLVALQVFPDAADEPTGP